MNRERRLQTEIIARSISAAAEHVYNRVRAGETAGMGGQELTHWLSRAVAAEVYSEPLNRDDMAAIDRRWDELDALTRAAPLPLPDSEFDNLLTPLSDEETTAAERIAAGL